VEWIYRLWSAGGENSDSDNSESEASVDDRFEENILALRSYSFIGLTTDKPRSTCMGLCSWLRGSG
jgi:hypothetical protein